MVLVLAYSKIFLLYSTTDSAKKYFLRLKLFILQVRSWDSWLKSRIASGNPWNTVTDVCTKDFLGGASKFVEQEARKQFPNHRIVTDETLGAAIGAAKFLQLRR